jgi:hypothetical protein
MSPSGVYGGNTNSWEEQFGKKVAEHHFSEWTTRTKDCNTSDIGKFWDEPSVLKSKLYPRGGSRFLYIQVVIKAAPNCPCPNSVLHLNIQQILFYDPQKRRSTDGWVELLTPPAADPGNLPPINPPWPAPSSC